MITTCLVTGLGMRLMSRSRKPRTAPQGDVPDPDSGKTSATLLDRVRDWRDHPAWMAFFERYNPLLCRWCGRFGLDADTSDDLCQRIWVELMARMRTFRYDPSRGYRNWLWRLFRSRAIDLLRKRRSISLSSLDNFSVEAMLPTFPDPEAREDTAEAKGKAESLILHRLATEAQEAVRSRVDPRDLARLLVRRDRGSASSGKPPKPLGKRTPRFIMATSALIGCFVSRASDVSPPFLLLVPNRPTPGQR